MGYACSCAWQDGVTEQLVLDRLCAADAVFVGEVESELTVRDHIFEYKIWPRESFKDGLESPTFLVSQTGGACGYRFHVQGRYLIFANRHEDTNYLSATICDLTRPVGSDDDVYKILVVNKDAVDEVCSDQAAAARRLERIREQDEKLGKLIEATQEHVDSNE